MREKKPLLLVLLLGLSLLLAGCGGRHEAEERYVLISANLKVPYWQTAKSGFFEAASQLKVKADVAGPDTYDPAAEKEAFRSVLQEKVKPTGILVSVANPQLLQEEIDQAVAQGIPVITMDSDAPESARLFFIGTNNRGVGLMGGRLLAEKLGGKGNVVVLTMPEQSNLKERLDGYRTAFAEYPGIRIVEVVDIKGDPRIAFDRSRELLEPKNSQVAAVVCLEAQAGKEVAEVIDRYGIQGKLVMAMDTDPATMEGIKKGLILATIAQKPYTMAFFGLETLDMLHHTPPPQMGKDWAADPFAHVPRFVDTGATLIDKENVDSFLAKEREAQRR